MNNVFAKLGMVVALVIGVAACGGGESADASQSDLSASSKTFVALRADTRACASPACRGFYVHDLNRKVLAETYVASLDFSLTGLDAAGVAEITSAPAGDLVLQGKLGAVDSKTKQRSFMVTSAWRGLPGVTPIATDMLFQVADKSTAQACVAAPCLNQQAVQLNATAATPFSSYSVEGSAKGWVDQAWLAQSIRTGGALVAGQVVDGAKETAGTDKVLAASQVYLRLPASMGSCPIALPQCGINQVLSFQRDETTRCAMPVGCVAVSACPQYKATCAAGYTLVQWQGGPNGCTQTACDPTFSM